MKIPKTKKLNKFKNTIKVLVIGLSLVLSIVAPNTNIHAEPLSTSENLVTVDKTSEKMEEFNKFKIRLDINTGKVEDSVEAIGNDIVLVLDTSGSMKSSGIEAVKKAAKTLLQNNDLIANSKNTFSIVSFASDVKTHLTKGTAQQAINALGKLPRSDGGTHLQAGLKTARDILTNSKNGYIVLLTDGEPTYSYDLNKDRNGYINGTFAKTTQADRVLGYNQNYYYTDAAINYGETIGTGQNNYKFGDISLIQNGNYVGELETDGYLLAENIALAAKQTGHKIFTIGYNTGSTVNSFLKRVASQGEGFAQKTSGDLSGIFNNIANSITTSYNTMIKDGVVTDPMSKYVNLLGLENGTYQYNDPRLAGIANLSQGSITVSGNKITWNVGDVQKESSAYLEYYVELKEEYINGTPYDANDTTTLKYNDYLDKTTSVNFPIPKVMEEIPIDSAALTVKKVVTNSSDDREFMIRIVGYDIADTNTVIYKTDLLLKNNESVTLEDLPFGKYTVSETVPMEYSLTGSDIGYSQETMMNGQEIELIQKVGQNEGYVVLTNNFGHVGFFKASDEKTNYLPAGENIVNNYQVNIDGNVKQTVSKAPQDVILVLDRSGSMNDPMGRNQTRLDVLKTNVINFINKLYEHNPNSRVSIITYSSSSSGTLTSGGFVTLSDNRRYDETWHTYLTKNNGAIKNITATGGTPTDIGLYEARNQLANATGSNNKSVILFTDGEPGNNGFDTSNYYYINGYRVGAEAINQAEFIKGIGRLTNVNNYISYDDVRYYGSRYDDVTSNRSSSNSNSSGNRDRSGQGLGTKLFVIGINSSNGSQFNDFLTRVASPGHYTKANDSAAMEEAFNSIFTSITSMDTDVAIRLKYDATKFTPIDLQGGTVGGSGVNSYIEWTNIIDKETGIFAVKGIKFKNIVANAGQLELSVAGYKNGQETQLANQNVSIVGN